MEPIVSPLTIYILSVVNHLLFFTQLLLFADLILGSCCLMFYWDKHSDLKYEYKETEKALCREKMERFYKGLKYSIIAGIVLGFLCVVIPNRDTLIAMLVASYVTPDNLSTANEVVKSNIQDYINMIMNGINSVK
jgi:hypothetical protein